MLRAGMEVIVVITDCNECFYQSMYCCCCCYKFDELKWGEKFKYLMSQKNGTVSLDVSGISVTEKAQLNTKCLR
jgi:inward rectifier potassium channel